MNMKRLFTFGALSLALAFAGCGKNEGGSSGGDAGAKPSGKKLKLAFVVNNASDFWKHARAGTDAAAKELGNVEVDFRIPSSGQAAEQRQVIDDLLAKGVDGIAVSVIDRTNQIEFLNKVAN